MNYSTMSTNTFTKFSKFLYDHRAKELGLPATHTRMGSETPKIWCGSYAITKDELPLFYKLYCEDVFVTGHPEYLTEIQIENGPLLLDFDFKYELSVTERIHTLEHIVDIINLYLDELKEFFLFEDNNAIQIYVMEKAHVNRVEKDGHVKDGVHIIMGIQMDSTLQIMLRDRILHKIKDVCDLQIKNRWEDVIDEHIPLKTSPWQLYGSQKPAHEAYQLTQIFSAVYEDDEHGFSLNGCDKDKFLKDIATNFVCLTAQNDTHPVFELNPSIIIEYNTQLERKPMKKKGTSAKSDYLDDITDLSKLEAAIENILGSLDVIEYPLKELHDYTQILPAKYYESGSHLLNRKVAFALKNADPKGRLFLSWVMLRSKASDFDYSTISELYKRWKSFTNREDGITKKSIIYWAKQDAYEDYMRLKQTTIDSFIENTLVGTNEFDLAMVLYHMFKDKYLCSSLIHKQWYIFKNHRWEQDKGMTLRLAISKDMFNAFHKKQQQYIEEKCKIDEDDIEKTKEINAKIKKILIIQNRLKTTADKNNIIREAMDLFYDDEFTKNMDSNKYLMCFTNGVVDFKSKVFRDGYPQDYITKSTNIPYVPLSSNNLEIQKQIMEFMSQLFPVQELNKYMWSHLASCLIGTNMNQTFNIYCGSGSNGKSLLTDLMSHTLGEYKGTVPITLVTEKRCSIGGTSSEIMQLKGIRYAVMQEPSKDSKINEGVMKELTGGDPVQGRALYCDSEIFEPQFKLVVCTNSLFEFGSNDDGTWRRIRKCDFMSKFVDKDEVYNEDTQYVFPKDKSLKEKLPGWASVFASILVGISFINDGNVKDCELVMESSNKYRQGQDHISAFVNDRIIKSTVVPAPRPITKTEISREFNEWYTLNFGRRKAPKGTELYEYIDKKFGKSNGSQWKNIEINKPHDNTEDDIPEDQDV